MYEYKIYGRLGFVSMEKIKNTVRNNLLLIMSIIAGVLIVGGIVLIVLGITLAEATFFKVMFIITSIVMILLGCVMTYFVLTVREQGDSSDEPNIFLYDPETEKNMSVDRLNFALVNKGMGKFMRHVSSTVKELWTGNIFDDDEAFGGVDGFKTLLAYKMLYDLADRDAQLLWDLYLNASEDLILSMSEQIERNCDAKGRFDEFGRYIIKLHSSADGNYEKSRKFILDNKGYLEKKMFEYAKSNIEKF